MRFKSLKGITLGKPKKEPDKENENENDEKFRAIASDRIANMEKRIHGKTKELEQKAQQILELSPESDKSEPNGDIPGGPHGPLSELTLENGNDIDQENTLAKVVGVDSDDDDDEDEEGIKMVEVSVTSVIPQEGGKETQKDESAEVDTPSAKLLEKEAETGEAPSDEAILAPSEPTEKEEESKLDDSDDSLNGLFTDEEEEENPLANLIRSLPDVSAQEIIDDLNEIKGIIKEWQKK
jgi:hypothetical protein